MYTMISVEDALAKVLESAAPLAVEQVDLMASVGRVLAEPVIAPHDLPPFENAAMDGYALRAEDTREASPDMPVCLQVVGESAAGRGYPARLQPGEAVTISTGAPVPSGADAVLPLEDAELIPDSEPPTIRVRMPVKPGAHIRPKGLDVQAGTPLLEAGTRLRRSHLGLLAALGLTPLTVYRRPRVAILATGSELVPYDAPLRPDSTRDSNSVMLRQWLQAWGIPYTFLGVVSDELANLKAQLARALDDAEVVLLTGGVSVGGRDLVKPALQQLGAEIVFWRVNMKPGKPIVFARRDRTAIFGLPGNPLAVVVGLLLFVRPYLNALEGEASSPVRFLPARLKTSLHKKESRAEFLTARLCVDPEGVLSVLPTPAQGSSLLGSLAQANAFLYLPACESKGNPAGCSYPAGTLVQVLPFAPLEGCG